MPLNDVRNTNYLFNPIGFKVPDTTGLNPYSAVNGNFTSLDIVQDEGRPVLQISKNTQAANLGMNTSFLDSSNLVGDFGSLGTISAWCKFMPDFPGTTFQFLTRDDPNNDSFASTPLGSDSLSFTPIKDGMWHRYDCTFVVNAGRTITRVYFIAQGVTFNPGDVWWLRDVSVTNDFLKDYFDGDSPESFPFDDGNASGLIHEHRWSGTPYASTSQELLKPGFTPPTFEEGMPTKVKPLVYFRLTQSTYVVRVGGTFLALRTPSDDQLAAAGVEGTDWFRGGCSYFVTNAIGSQLVAAGFSIT